MDLSGNGEHPPLPGTVLVPALARHRHALDIRQLAGSAHGQFPAATLPRVGLFAEGSIRGSVVRIRSRRKLDEPEHGFALTARKVLELPNLDVLESEIADGKRRSAGIDAALGQKLLILRFLIGAGAPSRDVRRRGDATFHV